MADDLIWTGSLNHPYAIRGSVGLYDTTLRDGEQTVGVVLSPDEKVEIARLLDDLGIDRIEAGFPRVSDDDWRAVAKVAACTPISRWLMRHCLRWCTNSMGSSMVRM